MSVWFVKVDVKSSLLNPAAEQTINTEILFLLASGSGFVCDVKAKTTGFYDSRYLILNEQCIV